MNFKKIFNWLPFLKKENDVKDTKQNTDKEFIFIWYKKMELGNKTQYTAKNRTKIIAKNRKEAIDKMTDFAMRKMTLVIHEEKDFSSSELGQMDKLFEDFNELMNKTFNNTKNKYK